MLQHSLLELDLCMDITGTSVSLTDKLIYSICHGCTCRSMCLTTFSKQGLSLV